MLFGELPHILEKFRCTSGGLFESLSLRRHPGGYLHHDQDGKVHGAQNSQHLVVLGQGPAMAKLAVEFGPNLHGQRIRDAIDEIGFQEFILLAHGKSSSCTLSNSATRRLRERAAENPSAPQLASTSVKTRAPDAFPASNGSRCVLRRSSRRSSKRFCLVTGKPKRERSRHWQGRM